MEITLTMARKENGLVLCVKWLRVDKKVTYNGLNQPGEL